MDKNKIFKKLKYTIYLLLVISFLVIYFSAEAGYFDSIKNKRVALTKDQIDKFEADIASGKEIDMTEYYSEIENPYNNKISELGLYLSNKIEKVVTIFLDKTFKALNDFLNS